MLDTYEKPWNINSFEQLGWFDPFPDEKEFVSEYQTPEHYDDLVYERTRY